MSSPISSLKKTKRPPMSLSNAQSNKNVPYRHDENSLLEEVTSRMTQRRTVPTQSYSSPGFISDPISGAPSDVDLMQSMLSRIALLEKHCQLQAKQIHDKDKRIVVLEDKCRLYQKMNSNDSVSSPRYVRDLETRCLLLQQQISEMEEFLLDYGMMWVGEKDETAEEGDEDEENREEITKTPGGVWNQNKSLTSSADYNPYNIDYDALIKNINELNMIVGDGETKIEKTSSGARFKIPDAIQLILYKNGIIMFEGPFRSFEEQSTQTCISDLMDGFFPSELQAKYPDGVPFKVIDKRDVTFEQKVINAFKGHGQSVGGDTQPSRLIPSIVNKSTNEKSSQLVESSLPGRKLTTDQFLSNLPSSVVRSGRVIDIRKTLSETLQQDGSSSEQNQCPVTIVDTQTMQEIKDRLDIEEGVRPPSGKNITTLRIKDTDNHTYVLKMKFSDTIQDVMNYLNELRSTTDQRYNLVTTFPSKVYNDFSENLFNAGLTPNATMHIRTVK